MREAPRFHPAVAEDLASAADYYRRTSSDLPSRLRGDFHQTINLLAAFPYLGRGTFDDYRHVSLRVFPYIVLYRITDDSVRVLAVAHARRDPAWIERMVKGRARSRLGEVPITTVLSQEPPVPGSK
ncbi:MAG: type II toxin-antitoxin system RelE/ParE family toxin [Bifidobacteriaceae bacterium]|nr:type II toxin-antitoxin system RelE/ParE family toxin [Bifidobacteriaceae bacterium]